VIGNGVRRFVYEYNGNILAQEVEVDLTGTMETPCIGSIVRRHDREWRVVRVIAPVSANGTVPIVRLFLNDITRSMERTSRVRRLPS
jgi:hypothetical protein